MCVLNVRQARIADLDDLISLIHEHGTYEGANVSFSEKDKENLASLLFTKKALTCMVVVEANQLVGYATYCIQYATWSASTYVYLDCLYLNEQARGKGMGKQLLSQMADFMKAEGIKEAQWQTPISNKGAIEFYQQLGANSLTKARFFWEPA